MPQDHLSSRPDLRIGPEDRVVVIGTSGSGKSTFARRLAKATGGSYIELDRLFWGRNWTPVDVDLFRERVAAEAAADSWVCDGNFGQVRGILWPRATVIIWLRYSFLRTFSRVFRRTVRRGITRETICGENQESLRRSFFRRDSIIVWMLQTWGKHRRFIPTLFKQPGHGHLRVLICGHPRDAERILEASLAVHLKSA